MTKQTEALLIKERIEHALQAEHLFYEAFVNAVNHYKIMIDESVKLTEFKKQMDAEKNQLELFTQNNQQHGN